MLVFWGPFESHTVIVISLLKIFLSFFIFFFLIKSITCIQTALGCVRTCYRLACLHIVLNYWYYKQIYYVGRPILVLYIIYSLSSDWKYRRHTHCTQRRRKRKEEDRSNYYNTTLLDIRTQEDLISKQFLLTGSVNGGRHMYYWRVKKDVNP